VDNWVARRFEASPAEPAWGETECVALDNNEAGTQEEWARRFSQREKQLLVGKGTRGYRRFLRMIPKANRKPGDPQTPRVAEQCSKRAFDGRLKQWRILLHAFSPRESEDEGEEGEPVDVVPEDTNLMEELHKALVKESHVQIPPTPPKPTALLSPSSKERTPGTPLSKGSRKSPNGTVNSRTMTPMPPVTPSRPADVERSTPTSGNLPVVPGFPFPGFSPDAYGVPSPLPSPAQIDAMSQLPPGSLDLMMGPEFKELAEQLAAMGTLPNSESLNAQIGALLLNQEVPPPNMDEAGMADGHLLPTDLLHESPGDEEAADLETTLDRAKVPEDLKPIFQEAFANVHHAFSKSTDEREVILANAARAVIGSMPPTEQAPLKVLDTLLAFLNELRASYGNPKTQGA
jgi:histone RNA hairpin-binding protein